MAIWNILLTAGLGVMGFMLKGKFDEVDRLGILLNRTREEVARDHITRAEVRADMEQVMAQIDHRFNRLEEKLDVIAGVKR